MDSKIRLALNTCKTCLISAVINNENCKNIDCKYHVFYKIPPRLIGKNPDPSEINGCMLMVNRPMTLDEIGRIFGFTRERIRQIQNNALKKLKEKKNNEFKDLV